MSKYNAFMSKYNAFIVILVALVLQSCSDESKSTDCSQCAQNSQCETCKECQQCPTCKEGDECLAPSCPTCPTCKEGDECPAPSCPTCPTCKEGDECPACPAQSCPTCPMCKEGDECPACNCKECDECKECPECNTDDLNSQLTSCNNELTTTKQALETEQNANESCVGDLDTCNKDLSDLSAKPRSKSGSRLIFKEHKMADGSVYVEPYPYDTKLNIACNFTNTQFGLCCIPGNAFIDYDISVFSSLYKDENCSISLSSLSQAELYAIMIHNCAKKGDVVFKRGTYNYCTLEYSIPSAFRIKSIYTMYQKQNDSCVKYTSNYPLVELEPVSVSEVISYYVCEE